MTRSQQDPRPHRHDRILTYGPDGVNVESPWWADAEYVDEAKPAGEES